MSLPHPSAGAPKPMIGVLINRRSGRNRAGLKELRNLVRQSPEVVARETSSRAEAAAVMREFSALGVGIVAVAGHLHSTHAEIDAIDLTIELCCKIRKKQVHPSCVCFAGIKAPE